MRVLIVVRGVPEAVEIADGSDDIATLDAFFEALRVKFEISEAFNVLVFDRDFGAYIRISDVEQIKNLAQFKVVYLFNSLLIYYMYCCCGSKNFNLILI